MNWKKLSIEELEQLSTPDLEKIQEENRKRIKELEKLSDSKIKWDQIGSGFSQNDMKELEERQKYEKEIIKIIQEKRKCYK